MMLTGNNGFLTRAGEAKNETKNSQEEEMYKLNNLEKLINNNISIPETSVYAKSYDVDTDGTADTLILSSVHDYDDSAYGNLITDYGNNAEYQKPGPSINQRTTIPNWKNDKGKFKKIIILDKIAPNTTECWFDGCNNLEQIENMGKLYTNNVLSMSFMFESCEKLSSIDVSNFVTSNVINMEWMFDTCNNVTELDISNFDTRNVVDMDGMFSYCNKLESINLRGIRLANSCDMTFCGCPLLRNINLSYVDTKDVIDMGEMFEECPSLERLDLSSFDTSNVKDMYWMFGDCTNLKELNLKSFNTTSVELMYSMFEGCTSLPNLDLSSFDTSNANNMQCMFADCTNLNNIKVGSNWSTTLAENTNFNNYWYNHAGYGTQNGIWYMFYNCGVDHVTK